MDKIYKLLTYSVSLSKENQNHNYDCYCGQRFCSPIPRILHWIGDHNIPVFGNTSNNGSFSCLWEVGLWTIGLEPMQRNLKSKIQLIYVSPAPVLIGILHDPANECDLTIMISVDEEGIISVWAKLLEIGENIPESSDFQGLFRAMYSMTYEGYRVSSKLLPIFEPWETRLYDLFSGIGVQDGRTHSDKFLLEVQIVKSLDNQPICGEENLGALVEEAEFEEVGTNTEPIPVMIHKEIQYEYSKVEIGTNTEPLPVLADKENQCQFKGVEIGTNTEPFPDLINKEIQFPEEDEAEKVFLSGFKTSFDAELREDADDDDDSDCIFVSSRDAKAKCRLGTGSWCSLQ